MYALSEYDKKNLNFAVFITTKCLKAISLVKAKK